MRKKRSNRECVREKRGERRVTHTEWQKGNRKLTVCLAPHLITCGWIQHFLLPHLVIYLFFSDTP